MRRVGAGLLAAVLALAGCKSSDPKPTDRDPAGLAAGRAKGKNLDWLGGNGSGVPKAGTLARPGDPGFNPGKEAQGLFGGRVIDPYGRGVKGVYIDVERADAPPGTGAPVSIQTRDDGYFMTQGLTPGVAYTLTARTQFEGKSLAGVVQARAPAPNITIQLRDDMILPPGAGRPGSPGGALPPSIPPPSGDLIPPVGVVPNPSATPRPADGGWVPGVGPTSGSVPATLPNPNDNAGGLLPKSPSVPNPDVPVTRIRPESTATGPGDPFRPPAASIPGPPVPPVNPAVPVIPPPPNSDPQKKSDRPVRPGANFSLVDTLQRPWEFATNRHGSLVLLDFMTTSCVPCKKSIPVLADLQARYGADGLQLVGVVCDDAPMTERSDRAAKYHQANNLNYALFVEPGALPGSVSDRFQVKGYPTAILLDSTGAVVWRGHPSMDRAALESAIRARIGK
jgi:thiol-disulfide isomerase/thioredoxin